MLEGQRFIVELDAARFRGEFLQCCAEIEDHLCVALKRLIELDEIKKAPYLFGEKFERVKKSSGLLGLWKHRDHAQAVIEALQPLVDMRGTLGHALIAPATIDGKDAICWQTPGNRDWADRRIMTRDDMLATLHDLQRLTKKFCKQPLADNG